jgi:RNase P/RNase MRP subunit p30
MAKRFVDLHVHSLESTGTDPRAELMGVANFLGCEIHFCDGKTKEDGLEISLGPKTKLLNKSLNASYIIVEPRTAESFNSACKIKRALLRTNLNNPKAKAMKKNRRALEVCLQPLFSSKGLKRVKLIRSIKTNLSFSRIYSIPTVVTTGAKTVYELRSPIQVFEILKALGFKDEEADAAMYKNPLEIISGKT